MILSQDADDSSVSTENNDHPNEDEGSTSPFHPPFTITSAAAAAAAAAARTTSPLIETHSDINSTVDAQPISTPSHPVSPSSTPAKDYNTNNNKMVHREPESPTQPSRSPDGREEDISDDVLFLKQNLQCKLGSVTPNRNDDDDGYESATAKNNVSTGKNEDPPDVELVFEALQILNGLAALNSSNYQAVLLSKNHHLSENPKIQRLLATSPPLVKLYQSIHRFHSQIRNLTTENDQQTTDLLDLHNTLEAKNERMALLETAVTKLHKQNTKLKARTKSNQSKTRKLFQQVQEFTANATKRKKEDDFSKLAMQVKHHEQVMTNRERTDSNFSDLDGLQDFFHEASSVASSADLETVSSTHSSVYEDGVATLRISRERTTVHPHHHIRTTDSEEDLVVRNNSSDELEEASPSRNKVEQQQQQQQENSDESRRRRSAKQHNPNPFAMLLGPRPAQPYTLQFLETFQLQFVALTVSSDKNEAPANTDDENEQSLENMSTAFAVCGYHGFDSGLNVKPTLGVRLLQINKQDLDPAWTVQDLEHHISELGSRATMTFRNETWSKSQKEALQMAIHEQDRLHPESTTFNPASPLMINPFARKRGQSSDNAAATTTTTPSPNKNMWGFLNFQGNGNAAETRKAVEVPSSTQKRSPEPTGHTTGDQHDTSKFNIARTNSKESQSSRRSFNDIVPSLPRNRHAALSPVRPTEITTKPVSGHAEGCLSFDDDEEQEASSSLFLAISQDASTNASQPDEQGELVDASEGEMPV